MWPSCPPPVGNNHQRVLPREVSRDRDVQLFTWTELDPVLSPRKRSVDRHSGDEACALLWSRVVYEINTVASLRYGPELI